MKVDIIIPTNKKPTDLTFQSQELLKTSNEFSGFIFTCQDGSAAYNRNYGIAKSKADIVIMIDDDIFGFYPGWVKDLIDPLIQEKEIGVISARLLKENGKPAIMDVWGVSESIRPGIFYKKWVPSACIAMRRFELLKIKESDKFPLNNPFDENYQKASFEDSDLLEVYRQLLNKKVAITNDCKLIHLNAESWRPGFRWEGNREYFQNKWEFTP